MTVWQFQLECFMMQYAGALEALRGMGVNPCLYPVTWPELFPRYHRAIFVNHALSQQIEQIASIDLVEKIALFDWRYPVCQRAQNSQKEEVLKLLEAMEAEEK